MNNYSNIDILRSSISGIPPFFEFIDITYYKQTWLIYLIALCICGRICHGAIWYGKCDTWSKFFKYMSGFSDTLVCQLCQKIFRSKLAVSYLPKNIQVQICRGRRKFWRQKPDIMNLVATFPDGKCAPGKFDNQPFLSIYPSW